MYQNPKSAHGKVGSEGFLFRSMEKRWEEVTDA